MTEKTVDYHFQNDTIDFDGDTWVRLPTQAELLARITALETAGRNAQDSLSALIVFIKLHKVEATPTEWDVIDKAIFDKNELATLLTGKE